MGVYTPSGQKRYGYINKGKICYKASKEDQVYTEVPGWKGHLVGIAWHMEEAKPEKNLKAYEALVITLKDSDGEINIRSKLNSGYGKAFLKIAGNINPDLEIAIVPTYVEKDQVKETGMLVEQSGKALKWYFTKADPKGMPGGDPVDVNGETVWSYTKQIQFLKDFITTTVLPKLVPSVIAGPATDFPVATTTEAAGDDDLPF